MSIYKKLVHRLIHEFSDPMSFGGPNDDKYCFFCGSEPKMDRDKEWVVEHDPNCLWMNAKTIVEQDLKMGFDEVLAVECKKEDLDVV